MEILPPEIQTLLQEGQLYIAAEKLHKYVNEALTANNYDAAAVALLALGSIKQTQGCTPCADLVQILMECLYRFIHVSP